MKDLGVNLSKSWILGDEAAKDILLGREMNIKTIKIGKEDPADCVRAHHYAANLADAAAIILGKKE